MQSRRTGRKVLHLVITNWLDYLDKMVQHCVPKKISNANEYSKRQTNLGRHNAEGIMGLEVHVNVYVVNSTGHYGP